MKKIYYYNNYEEDIVKTKNQDIKIKDNYTWIHKSIIYKIYSYLIYSLFYIFGLFYIKLVLKVSIKNKKVIHKKKNIYIYANHTQEMGDAFIPPYVTFPNRPYIIVNKANLGIPILGRLLPSLGAIVIPDKIHDYIKFIEALKYYGEKHPIIIYPEAHVWPYYTKIRPFNDSSFKLAIENKKEVYSMTITYQKRKYSKKPKIVIYIDGPFKVDNTLSKKEQIKNLSKLVRDTMIKRSNNSNIEYIKYTRKMKSKLFIKGNS